MKKCKLHPRYKAIRPPVKTKKHPEGCTACKEIYQEVNGK
jgi:hypothetical protein